MIRASGFRWERATDVVRHVAVNAEPTPYRAPAEEPSP